MGPLLRYLVIALFVVLGTSWLISSYQGCQKKSETSLIDDLENADDSDLWEEDLEEGDVADGDADDYLSSDPEDLDAEIERLERDLAGELNNDRPKSSAGAAPLERSKPKVTTVSNPTPRKNKTTNYSPSKGAQFLVVAGSYSKNPNARAMARRLESKGYDNAEVVEFDYSKYFSVLAGRFTSEEEARAVAAELQENGVEAYVHRKR